VEETEAPVATPDSPQDAEPKKRSKLPLVAGILGAFLAGGGGFYATYSGLLWPNAETSAEKKGHKDEMPDIAYVAIEPVVISLAPTAKNEYLKMSAQLEVERPASAEVAVLMPRILDVLNGYLRAIDAAQIEDPSALVRIRAQLLRRIQVVVGEGRVRDLLITEFVLN
jgi:flagellar protein FliL